MADKNIQMTQRNPANTGWDNLYPKTKAGNVFTLDGKTLEEFKTTTISQLDTKANLVEGKIPVGEIPSLSYVPPTRTINGKALSSDINLSASDVGAGGLPGYSVYGYANGSNSNYSVTGIDTLNTDYTEAWIEVSSNTSYPDSSDTCIISLDGTDIQTIKFSQRKFNLVKIFFIKGTYGIRISDNDATAVQTFARLFDRLIVPPTNYVNFTRKANSRLDFKGSNNNLVIGNVTIIGRK